MEHAQQPQEYNPPRPTANAALAELCALFVMLFGNPFALLFERLEALFAAWRAGLLPPLPAATTPPRQPGQAAPRNVSGRAYHPRAPRAHVMPELRPLPAATGARPAPAPRVRAALDARAPASTPLPYPQKRDFCFFGTSPTTSNHAHFVPVSQLMQSP